MMEEIREAIETHTWKAYKIAKLRAVEGLDE